MNNIDRFIRVVYTEADLAHLMNWSSGFCAEAGGLGGCMLERVNSVFWFPGSREVGLDTSAKSTEVEKFQQSVVEKYLGFYPKNYNDNEIHLLIRHSVENVAKFFDLSEEINSAYFFPYCAFQMLTKKGSDYYIKDKDLFEWDGILNKIDSSVLFAAYHAFFDMSGGSVLSAQYDNSRLKKILSKGYAENHAHLWGSGISAEINWFAFIYLDANNRNKIYTPLADMVKEKWRDKPESQQKEIIFSFSKVPLLRSILDSWVSVIEGESLASALFEDTEDGFFCKLLQNLFSAPDNISLAILRDSEEFRRVLAFNEQKTTTIPNEPHGYTEFEQSFLSKMFTELRKKSMPRMILYAFNVYIVAITQFKLCVLQDNVNFGFKRFSRSQDKKTVFLDCVGFGLRSLAESVFDKYYRAGNVKYAELRIGVAPKKELNSIVKELNRANDKVYNLYRRKGYTGEKIKYGLILHFSKPEFIEEISPGLPRWHQTLDKLYKKWLQLAAIYEQSEKGNELISKIVAIDAAAFEITTRPEVFGPMFRTFTGEISKKHHTGLTYHVGEDFVSLPNGLRAIDEAMDFLELSIGDRLGHATALGIDVKKFYAIKRDYVTNTLQEHVDDLAWMYGLISSYEPAYAELLNYLQHAYATLAPVLFADIKNSVGNDIVPDIETYEAARKLRGDAPETVSGNITNEQDASCVGAGFGSAFALREKEESCNTSDIRYLYRLYQYSCLLKKQGLRPYVVKVDDLFIEAVELVQSIMRRKVHDRQVSIEANPTSNRKISPMNRYIDSHIFKLNQHGLKMPASLDAVGDPDIPITINSDDSGVFQTDLALEYAYIFEAMRREGFDLEETYAYIDYLRELSLLQNFVCRNLGDGDQQKATPEQENLDPIIQN